MKTIIVTLILLAVIASFIAHAHAGALLDGFIAGDMAAQRQQELQQRQQLIDQQQQLINLQQERIERHAQPQTAPVAPLDSPVCTTHAVTFDTRVRFCSMCCTAASCNTLCF